MNKTLEDLTRRIYADEAAGNHDTLIDALADDVVLILNGSSPHAGKYAGKAALLEAMGRASKAIIEESRTIDKLLSNEDTVVVIGREEFTVVPTGKRAK